MMLPPAAEPLHFSAIPHSARPGTPSMLPTTKALMPGPLQALSVASAPRRLTSALEGDSKITAATERLTPPATQTASAPFDALRSTYTELMRIIAEQLEAGTTKTPESQFQGLLEQMRGLAPFECAFFCAADESMRRLLRAVQLHSHLDHVRVLLKPMVFEWLGSCRDSFLYFAFYIAESADDFVRLCSSVCMDATLLSPNKAWSFEVSYTKACSACRGKACNIAPVMTISRAPYKDACPPQILPIALLL